MKTTLAVVALVLAAACAPANSATSKFHDLLTQKNIAPHDMAEAETLAKSLCAKLDQGYGLGDLMAMYGDFGNNINAKRAFLTISVTAFCPEYGAR
ncbi:hypothetical protein ADK67_25435 [Saccharothrix sp. NRRL B-16348]|uniref:DUF732 domain-containing protein n=1 Tax=Saccharothrix sp. NRRL B-16348 TaxID=1415542 RepID=UPI0006AFCBF2|nr:DUF732 domain-containing protein [Saccharothrix sp. NRRL B-16348]KOX21716.1 hypothetical protein ADK67_25435 [Saccharothrix sp. NRRL B-16348]